MVIIAGSGHSAIEKSEKTEKLIREFEENGACMHLTAQGVKVCCKVPGNLKSIWREGDIIKYECIVCHRRHNFAFSEAGELILRGMAANQRRIYEINGSGGNAGGSGGGTV